MHAAVRHAARRQRQRTIVALGDKRRRRLSTELAPLPAPTLCKKCVRPIPTDRPSPGRLTWSYGNWWVAECAHCAAREEAEQDAALCRALAQASLAHSHDRGPRDDRACQPPAVHDTGTTSSAATLVAPPRGPERRRPCLSRARRHLCGECGDYIGMWHARGRVHLEDDRYWSTSCSDCVRETQLAAGAPPPAPNDWCLPPPRPSPPLPVPPEPPP